MFDLSGKVALVTGAGQHVGAGVALALAGQGARVAVNDVVAERAESTVAAVRSAGGVATLAVFDVTDGAAVGGGVRAIAEDLGPVDILVNNAGIPAGFRPRTFRELEPTDWARFVDLNLYGSLYCIRAVVDGMCDRRWGRIVQISSGAGQRGLAMGIALYGASKSAVEGFIRHLSQEVAGEGVTANSVALGTIDHVPPERLEQLARRVPVGRLGSPADVGAAVVFLASEEAAWLTGQTIQLSGGVVTT
jgi:NAD(P)-dependent dehydrogenase (short-subunit alcohol dehydrogenase family)